MKLIGDGYGTNSRKSNYDFGYMVVGKATWRKIKELRNPLASELVEKVFFAFTTSLLN